MRLVAAKTGQRTRAPAVAVVAAILTFALSACPSAPISLPKHRAVHPTGQILGAVPLPTPQLIEFLFSSDRSRSVPLAAPALSAFFWGSPAVAHAFVPSPGGTSRLVEVEGAEVRPVSLFLPAGVRPMARPLGDVLVAGSCMGRQPIFVLNLRTRSAPREVAQGCPAALSPDGRSVAYSPDLVSVWTIGADEATHPEPLFRLTGRQLLLSLGMRQPRIIPNVGMSWGRAGLAVAVEGEGRFACLLAMTSGRVQVLPLGTARPTALAWDPRGVLLAFTEHDKTGGALRVYDSSSHLLRLAALAFGKDLQGLVWSPRGDALVTLAGTDRWVVVTAGGTTIRSIAVPPGAIPLDWAP